MRKRYIPPREIITEMMSFSETVSNEEQTPSSIIVFKEVPVHDVKKYLPSREDLQIDNLLKAGINPQFVNPNLLNVSDPYNVETQNTARAARAMEMLGIDEPTSERTPEPTSEPIPEPQPTTE